MLHKLPAVLILACVVAATPPVLGQTSVTYKTGVTMLPGGGLYDGTVDAEFRSQPANQSQPDAETITVDNFDGGNQVQAAIRFENLFVSQGGLVPDDLPNGAADILNAEFVVWKDSSSDEDASITFSRILGPDSSTGDPWEETDSWLSLGGDLIANEGGQLDCQTDGLPDVCPIRRNDVEAASVPDFTDLLPALDSSDLLGEGIEAGKSIADAIDDAFYRFNATEAVRAWYNGAPNLGWTINNSTGDGWDMASSELISELDGRWSDAGLLPEHFRPSLVITYVDGPLLDVDGDSDVDEDDFQAFVNLLGVEIDGPIPTGDTGDFDFDRDVDLDDFKFFKANYAEQHNMFPPIGAGGASGSVVPEPASAMFAVIALLLSFAGRRYRANA